MGTTTPDPEVEITDDLVRRLIADQFPALASRPTTLLASGWDNTMYRVGDDVLARLPRRQLGADLIASEQRWLPGLAAALPLPVPAPIHRGTPTDYYPWAWSIVPFAEGIAADLTRLNDAEAIRLGAFLKALHVPAPADAPANAHRGVPLANRLDAIEARMASVGAATDLITPVVAQALATALAAPAAARPTWVHGDLHPRNIVVHEGRLSAIIDWGDLCAGDGANDLAAFWMLFDDRHVRAAGLAAYGATTDQIARARGWAVFFGTILAEVGLNDDPRFLAIGERTLRNL
ncbi:MAG: aminoglycoside phosphotransferase family protein [Acidimicrobiales bacterium]